MKKKLMMNNFTHLINDTTSKLTYLIRLKQKLINRKVTSDYLKKCANLFYA